jgi:ABC-type nitrate/sulfonate/bicarbonate transport system ATPase subunit
MIQVDDLSFAYQGQGPVLQHFSWRVGAGELWSIIGPSGCGKSTLLYLVAGLRQPQGGSILVNGQPVPRPRASIGLVLQDYGLLPWATVWQNVALVMDMGRFYRGKSGGASTPRPYPRADIEPAEVDHWLERLGLQDQRNKYPGQLSGGQRQRAAIGRSLLQHPDLLLLDEPFSSLDALTREDLQRLTLELCSETGLTTILVTHNIEEAVYLGRRVLVLGRAPNSQGVTIENPNAGKVEFRQQASFLTQCNLVRAALDATREREQ